MPLTTSNLRRLLKSKHPYIERNIDSVVSIIRHSIKNAAAFEEAVKYLKERRLETATKENILDTKESGVLPHKARKALKTDDTTSKNSLVSVQCKEESRNIGGSKAKVGTNKKAKATVQVPKKPSLAFGALLGNSAKRQFEPDKRKQENTKLEQIKSSSLPLRTFLNRDQPLQSGVKKSAKISESSHRKETVQAPAFCSTLEDVIVLDDNSDEEESRKGNSKSPSDDELMRLDKRIADFAAELDEDDEDEPM